MHCQVARFEPSAATNYAQTDIYDGSDQWSEAIECIRALGGSIGELVSAGVIGPPSLDVGLRFPSGFYSSSASIPANLAEAAGRAGMNIDISMYLTENRTR